MLEQLVRVAQRYELLAVQELSESSEAAPLALLDALNADGAYYDLALSPLGGLQPSDAPYRERYAFYYDTRVVSRLAEGQLYDDSIADDFVREPYAASFKTRGGLRFAAVTLHTQPDTALAELAHLTEVVGWAQSQLEQDHVILLGDFNAGCAYASPAELDALDIRQSDYAWLVPDDADTNVATSQCAYDRIVLTRSAYPTYTGNWGVDTELGSGLSDHFPVWAELSARPP